MGTMGAGRPRKQFIKRIVEDVEPRSTYKWDEEDNFMWRLQYVNMYWSEDEGIK